MSSIGENSDLEIKKGRVSVMDETFYLICTDEEKDWWQLRLIDNHMVISCGQGKERMLECLEKIVRRYRTKHNLMKKLRNCDYATVGREQQKERQAEYLEIGSYCIEDIAEVVFRTLKDLRKDNDVSKNRNKVKLIKVQRTEEEVVIPELPKVRTESKETETPKIAGKGLMLKNKFKRIEIV